MVNENCPLCGKLMERLLRKEEFVVGRSYTNTNRTFRVIIDYEHFNCSKCEESFTTNEMDESNDNKIRNEIRDQKIEKLFKKSL
jgi:hypothetical protein